MSTEYTSMERNSQPTGTMGHGAGSQAEFASMSASFGGRSREADHLL